jgi:hypothetical protein
MTDFFEQFILIEAEADIVVRRHTICLPRGSPERGSGGWGDRGEKPEASVLHRQTAG